MSTSIFEQVTSSLTVMSICGSLGPDIPAGTPLSELENLLDPSEDPELDPWNDPSRVIDSDGDLVGILCFSDYAIWEEEEDPNIFFVDDVIGQPEPWQFLSSPTSILEAVELFARRPAKPFYVIHGNQLVGYLEYQHLFHPVGRLAFLALALEIEDLALRLCQHPPFRQDAWQSISDGRRCKATELFRQIYGRKPEPLKDIDKLIDCTQLKNKATMIWRANLVSSESLRSVLGFFEELRKIRDSCAHPQRSSLHDALIEKQRLSKFINGAKSMRNALNEALLNHRVSRQHYQIVR